MLACARIGAAHSVIFGGFSADSIRDRIEDSQSKLMITADGGYRRGNVVPLKQNADDSITGDTPVEKVVVVRRTGTADDQMVDGRDVWWHELVADQPLNYDPEQPDHLSIKLESGELIESKCAFPLGSPQNPMNLDQLSGKFQSITGHSKERFQNLLKWPQTSDVLKFFREASDH